MAPLRTALYPWHQQQGARFVPFAGWEMPLQYGGIVAEHRAVRTQAGMFDVSHMARFYCRGPQGAELLDELCTNAVAAMADYQVRYNLMCSAAGGTRDDVLVYRWPDGFLVVANAANREKILLWLAEHRRGGVEIVDETFATSMIAVQGPAAVSHVAELCGAAAASLKYYQAMQTRWRDVPVRISRTGYTGEDGFELIVPNAAAGPLWETLLQRGVVPCGLGARDTLRLEAALPLYGHELSEEIGPIAAGLAWAVKFAKGDFVGREALLRQQQDATLPRRVGLVIEGRRAARAGSVILDANGQTVGTVTSGSFCPWLEQSLAMGYVSPAHAAPGTALKVSAHGTELAAQVAPLPFYRRAR